MPIVGIAVAAGRPTTPNGAYSNGTAFRTLVLHWNGTVWKHVPSPNPGGSSNVNELSAVAAASASDVWAVGGYNTATGEGALAIHCC